MPEVFVFTIDKFSFRVPTDRLYSAEGLWALAKDGIIRTGLSDYLQQRSGDVAFVDVQPGGKRVRRGELLVSIETIKITSDLHSPLTGRIASVNPAMQRSPEDINRDPYGEGWVCELEPEDWEEARLSLMTPQAYFAYIQQDAAQELE